MSKAIALVMPVFNEADGIADFLREIDATFSGMTVVIVDDCSTDTTRAVIESTACANCDVRLVRNDRNQGHGPTTLRALREGVAAGASTIVAFDGDGQAEARELQALLAAFAAAGCDVLEGIRSGRQESLYRRLTSWATRVLTRVRARASVPDANTPFRVYNVAALTTLLDVVPSHAMVPNLWITVASRRMGMRVRSATIITRPRRGVSATGSTWGATRVSLPSRRFVRFCARAVAEWVVQWPHIRRVVMRNSPHDAH